MAFWQHLVASYEKNAEALKNGYPLSSTTISNNADIIAVVVINGEGKYQDCYAIPMRPATGKKRAEVPLVTVTVPVTEKSLGRSSGICPNPVFDQFDYLKGSGKKFEAYISQLKQFAESEFATDQIRAVFSYVSKKTLEEDLSKLKAKPKTNVLFEVEMEDNLQHKLWEDESFFEAWRKFYLFKKRRDVEQKRQAQIQLSEEKTPSPEKITLQEQANSDEDSRLDFITGKADQLVAISHPKKLANGAANTKLISDNDKANFTFRGKFSTSTEAVSIGYESSQKAHQFLRYLINKQGYCCGEQVILSYTIGSVDPEVPPPLEEGCLWSGVNALSKTSDRDVAVELSARTGFDYADSLKKALAGYGKNIAQKEHEQTAVIALDAATTGRLSITFYREMERGEYLERITDWHKCCKWHQQFYDDESGKYVPYVGAPTVDRIIEAAYGKPRGRNDESYTKIKKAARERLLRCIFDGADIPLDYVTSAVRRASNPLSITRNGKFNRHDFGAGLSTACALVRKDYQQRNKEVYDMSIELERTDRDYLYGRLLGAADKLEEYALYRKKNDRVVTAAIRHMQAFAQRPFRTWTTIHSCLNPYIQQVKDSFGFSEIQAINNQFEHGDFEKDTPLGGAYLIGYYHERAHIDGLVKELINKGE